LLEQLAMDASPLTPMRWGLCQQLAEELTALDTRVASYDAQLAQVAQSHPVCQWLRTIPGLGELTATAWVAAVSEAAQFKNGRQLAAWRGLVPRQHSTGSKVRLLGLSKHDDLYRRKLLVHGARGYLRWVERKSDRRSQ